MIKISQLEALREDENILLLLAAMNDWPNTVGYLEEYLSEVRSFLGVQRTTVEAIEHSEKRKLILYYTWQFESLAGVLEILKNTNYFSLEDYIILIKKNIKNKIIKIIDEALSDWPDVVSNIWDYYSQIQNKIDSRLVTKKEIDEYLDSKILRKTLWYDESLAGLRRLFEFYNSDLDIKDIFEENLNLINQEINF